MKMSWMVGLCVLTALGTVAQDLDSEDIFEMSIEEILDIDISTASKSEMSVDDAPGIVSVLTREDIRNYGAETLGDILNLVPGITTGKSFQNGYHDTLYVRGSFSLSSETVLILKNGQRLNDPITGGAVTFSPDYPLTHVKQIEIIRGPGSALYGANAFVALINLITDELETTGGFAEVKPGDKGGMVSAQYGKSWGKTRFSLSADYLDKQLEDLDSQPFTQYASDNPPPFPIGIDFNRVYGGNVSDDKGESWHFSSALAVRDLTFRFDYEERSDGNNWGSGVPGTPVTDSSGTLDLTAEGYNNTFDAKTFRIGSFFDRQINDRTTLNASLVYNDFSQETMYKWINLQHIGFRQSGDGYHYGAKSDSSAQAIQGELSLEWKPKDNHVLVAGYSYGNDQIDRGQSYHNRGASEAGVVVGTAPWSLGENYLAAGERTVHALYGQYTWQVNQRFAMTGGVRGDDYSDFGSTVNPRLALVFSPHQSVNIKALYGQAFRAPTFLERNNYIGGGIIPNPDLQPEEIKTTELQAIFKPANHFRALVSAYTYQIDNVLRQVPTNNPNAMFETQTRNTGEREGNGIEVELRYQKSLTRMVFLNYFHAESKDLLAGTGLETDVEGVPSDGLNFGFVTDYKKKWVFGVSGYQRWSWTSQSAISLPTIEIPGYGGVDVDFLDELSFPDYLIINANLAWRDAYKGFDFSLDVNNALDEQMVFGDQHSFAPGGLVTGGRVIKLGARYAF